MVTRYIENTVIHESYADHRAAPAVAACPNMTTLTYECGPASYVEFPRTEEPVYILGEKYSTLYDLDELKQDIKSRLWFTYRKNFPSIGGVNGPGSDTGWGCMLRCGQMLVAQALVTRHLGREWRWDSKRKDEIYMKILKMFQDKKGSYYSIHQIASMGVSEGKPVGQWFGPNTVAQVLKKLVVYDEWSSLVIHVAMDNTVIENDIRCLCKCKQKDVEMNGDFVLDHIGKVRGAEGSGSPDSNCYGNLQAKFRWRKVDSSKWKPLLLVIPLRLGLTEINSVYVDGLKSCLSFPQTVGIIGGKPNHAHWFIGYIGDQLIYLDPHTQQMTVDLDDPSVSDESFHCYYPCRMSVYDLDPSIAVGFYCGTEEEFDDLCVTIQKFIIKSSRTPMFELYKERPPHWPPFEAYSPGATNFTGYVMTDVPQFDTDEEFELL
ncbi:hypothetical protein ScPMuIL_018132 [Solemya velum]